MKKGDRSEKLSEWLSQVNDDLLDEAYSIDSADRLKERMEGEKTVRKTVYIRNYVVRRLVSAALCLLVIAGVLLAVPALFKTDEPLVDPSTTGGTAGRDPSQPDGTGAGEPSKPDEDPQGTQSENSSQPDGNDHPNVVPPTEWLHIDSIDMLNYYSAIRILGVSSGNALSNLSMDGKKSHGLKLLAAGENTPPDDTTPPPPSESVQPSEVSESEPDLNIYYYELDPDVAFCITKVSFFQIELSDETGFLASKLGTGVVDVVITEGVGWYGDPMITFKNGDRYFSCLCNGGHWSDGSSWLEFTTHKYIEGFYIVKNFKQENYAFSVSIEGDQVVSFECSNWDRGENPDGVLPVVSKTYISNETFWCTVTELEEYFNAGALPEQ